MAITLVVAWDADLKEPLEARRSVNMRQAKQIAEELEKEYPWSPRISFYQEVDFLATEAGMTPTEVQRAMEHLTQRKPSKGEPTPRTLSGEQVPAYEGQEGVDWFHEDDVRADTPALQLEEE